MLQINSKNWILIFLLGIVLLSSCKSSRKNTASRSSKRTAKVVKKGSESSVEVVNIAKSYIGTPYKYGGTTRGGMDCSGLIYTSFQKVNKSLPRTSSAQSQIGKKIKLNDIEVGDLVFFTSRKGRKKVTHVGMVTEVRGKEDVKFIHASTKLGVVESNLFVDYYRELFLFAVRVLN